MPARKPAKPVAPLPASLRGRLHQGEPWQVASDVFHHYVKREKDLAPAVKAVRAHVKALGFGEDELPDASNFLSTLRYVVFHRENDFSLARKHRAALQRVAARLDELAARLPQHVPTLADPLPVQASREAIARELKALAGAARRPFALKIISKNGRT